MANPTDLEDFKTMVNEMMKNKGIGLYELDLKGNSNVGDGYMGEMLFFEVISKANGKSYHLVQKAAPKDDKTRKVSCMGICFDREIFMYTTIFPALKSFISEKKKSVTILENLPTLFWYREEFKRETIILENLKEKGYTMWKKFTCVDFEHTKMIVKKLGEFHGLVLAFRDQNLSTFQSWAPRLYDIRYKQIVQLELVSHAQRIYKKIIKLFEEKGEHELAKKYIDIEDKLEHFLMVSDKESDRLVINLGDCWINNIMFKFEDSKEVATDIKLLDFQIACLNTPVQDVSFFIYSSCDGSVLERLDDLLEEYYSSLSTTMKTLGSNPEEVFSFAQLQEHWKNYAMVGVLSGIEIIKIRHLTEDEILRLEKLAEESGKPMADHFDFNMKANDVYFEQLLNLFRHFGNKYL